MLVSVLFSSGFLEGQTLHTLNKDLPCLDRNFNLSIHIMVDSLRETGTSLAAIQEAVNSTNQMFEPICVTFSICEIDTIWNYNFDSLPTPEEMAEKSTIFQKPNRLKLRNSR